MCVSSLCNQWSVKCFLDRAAAQISNVEKYQDCKNHLRVYPDYNPMWDSIWWWCF